MHSLCHHGPFSVTHACSGHWSRDEEHWSNCNIINNTSVADTHSGNLVEEVAVYWGMEKAGEWRECEVLFGRGRNVTCTYAVEWGGLAYERMLNWPVYALDIKAYPTIPAIWTKAIPPPLSIVWSGSSILRDGDHQEIHRVRMWVNFELSQASTGIGTFPTTPVIHRRLNITRINPRSDCGRSSGMRES